MELHGMGAGLGIRMPDPTVYLADSIKPGQKIQVPEKEPVFVFIPARMDLSEELKAGRGPVQVTLLKQAPQGATIPKEPGAFYELATKPGKSSGREGITLVTSFLGHKSNTIHFEADAVPERYY
jgi:hypothetical protein